MTAFDEVIRSRQNRTVVELGKLLEKKHREEKQAFRFDGIKLLEEAIQNDVQILCRVLREDRAEDIKKSLIGRFGETLFSEMERTVVLSVEVFDKISEEKSPEGVITVGKYIDKIQKNATIYNSVNFSEVENERIVLLESVRDPSNLGAIVRSAAALGVDRLILSADCADIYNPRAMRAAMGTLFNQRIDYVTDLPTVIQGLRQGGRRVFAATLDARAARLGDEPLAFGDCVVIGNEGHGLSKDCIEACDCSVFIPMTERAESFNAAVAASILMWEFSKTPNHREKQ